jgi:hypothetical protein
VTALALRTQRERQRQARVHVETAARPGDQGRLDQREHVVIVTRSETFKTSVGGGDRIGS